MRISLFSLANASAVSLMLLFGLGASQSAIAQINPNPTATAPPKSDEITTNDSVLPLVYSKEDSGATTGSITVAGGGTVSTSNGTPAWPSLAKLPIVRPLPDPFTYVSTGTRDTSFAAWEAHRQDILNGFETYMVGPKPDCSDCTITATYTPAFAVGTTKYTLTITVKRTNPSTGLQTTTLTSAITLPAGAPPANGWPFVMAVDGSGYTSAFPSASIATVPFTSSQVTSSDSPTTTDGFFKLYYPTLCDGLCPVLPSIPGYATYNGNEGQFAAWAWGVSRLLDGVQIVASQATNPLPLDMKHTAITGCSYAGKVSLWGGALDERVTLTASEEAGGGGSASWRYLYDADSEYTLGTHDGSVEDIDTTDHRWWSVQAMQSKFSSVDVYKMPVDLHEVAALAAPRALVLGANTTGYWLSADSTYVSARAIQQVYNTFGIGDRLGFIVDSDHGHCAAPAGEVAYVAQFVNKFMLGQNVSTDVESYPNGATAIPSAATVPSGNGGYSYIANSPSFPIYFPTMDYQRWTAWWGTSTPQFPNDWNTGGTTDLWFNNPITISTGDTVEAGYAIQMSAATHAAATVKLPNANIQTDVTCGDGSSYTLLIPLYANTGLEATSYGTGQSYTIPVNNNAWYPAASGSTTYQGSVKVTNVTLASLGANVNTGCADGNPGTAGRAYLVALGAQSNTNGNPAGPGFVTTDTTQSPLWVQFHLLDSTNGQGGAWSPAVLVNQLPVNIRQ